MTIVRSYVFVPLPGGPVPAELLTMTGEPRNQFATFAYGRRYLERPDRIPVDPVALPLHGAGTSRTFRTEEGFAVFVLGGSLGQSNPVIADWPGLRAGQLYQGRDLAPTMHFAQLVTRELSRHYDLDPALLAAIFSL